MEVSKNTHHWISPNALTIGLNFGGMPDYIQVSVLANAVILSYVPGIIGFDAAHNYRSWNLTAFNTHLSSASSHYVYARLDVNGKDALIVYDTEERNIYGATDDNPEFVDNEHYYIYIGRLSSNYNSSTLEKQQRTWEDGPYFGSLSTDQYNNEELTGGWSKLFQLDEITDKIIFLKPIKEAIIDRLNIVREFIFDEKTITGIHDSTDLSSEDHTPDDEHLATSAYISEMSDKKYIRKDKDDYTPFTLTVKRLIANISSVFKGGLQIGEQYVDGMTGVGGNIDEMANAELESLKLRSFLEVPELRFNRVDVVGGELWNAVAFGLIERVDTENQIAYLHLVDGELSGIHANDICRGIFHNLTGNSSEEKEDDCGFLQLVGYSTSYFTPTTIRSNDSFAYSLRAGTATHPCAGMKFAVYGSFTDKDRQHSAYHTRGYTRYLKGVNTWQIVPDRNIASQFGKIEGLTIGSMTMKGYGSFQDNCYFTGANIQFSKETLDELKGQDAYTAVLTDYEGVVKVDNEGNIQGSMEEQMNVTTNEYNVTANSESDNVTATRFRLTTSVQAFHGSQQLYYSDAVRQNAFTIRTDAFGCEAGVENGLVYINKIDTSVPSHYVNVYINCEGNVNFLQVFTVTAIEIGDSPVTIDLDNEMVSLSSDDKGNVTLFPAEGIYTRGTLWYGNTEMYVDEVYAEVPSGISYNILLTSHRYADLEVTGVSQSAADCNILRIHMIGRMSETHERQYERVAEFTVNKVKMGENAVYYSLKPSVSSVKIADDKSYSASSVSCAVQKNDGSSASTLSSLGGNLRMDYSVDGGSFSTYSYGSSVSTDGIEKSVTFRLYWLDEDSGSWILIDREDIPFVSDGTNPVFCDLDNEMAAVAADEDGNVTGTSTVSTVFSMYGGNKKLALSALSVASAPSGITTSTDRSSGKVTVTVGDSAANRNVISISGSAVFQGVTETRSIDFIVSKLRTGKDAVVYQLNPSNNAISVDAAGSYTPGYISCNLLKTKGTEPAIETSVIPSGYSVYYSVDGGTEKSYTLGSSLSVSSVKTMIRFVLYYMGDRVDVETIPVAADGNGIASVIVYYMRTETNSQPSSSASGWRTYSDGTAPKPDDTYRYVWKKTVTNYKDGSQTVYIESAGAMGADGVSPNASYKSTVFIRTNETPSTPTGGSYDDPVPDGWSDGIPEGEAKLWASTRIFSTDGLEPQQSTWTTPRALTDTASFDVEFSSYENPSNPSGHPNTNAQWTNTSSSNTIWMATSTKENGVWSDWQVSKIKGERGEDGTSIKIKGSLNSESELPDTPDDPSDCYIIGTDIWIWDGSAWKNAGQFKGSDGKPGDPGKSSYLHIKYANSLTTNDWTNNNGETPGPYIGVYVDNNSADQLVWSLYTWSKFNGDDATSYWFDTPCSVIHFTNTGYPSPSSFVVTMKKKKGEGDSSNCADYYLATYRSSDGSTWTRIAGNSSKGASITVTPSQSTNYVQYRVAAFTSSSFSESTMFMQLVIGVSIDGMDGDGRDGDDGYFPRDRGVWDSSKTYVWNDVYRDKVVYNINGIFYNFIVASKGLSLKSVAPTLGGGTSEGSSDGSWELMSTYRTLVADTLFGDKANIGGFMVNGQEMRSQNEVGGEPSMTINGIRGILKARQKGGTVFSLDEKGRVTAGIEDGKRIELRSDEKSIGIFGEDGTETTTLSGDSFDDMESIFAGSGGAISIPNGSRTLSPVTIDGGSFVSGDVVGDDSTTLVGGCELRISISSLKCSITPGSVPSGSLAVMDESSISVYVNSYSDASCTNLTSRRVVVGLNDNASLSSKVYTVNLGKGYHKLSVYYYIAANKGGTGSVSWGSMTATYAVDFFRSVYFSQGFALGRNAENVIAALIQSGYMKFTAKSGGCGLDVSSSGVKTMIGSGWSHVSRMVFAARVTVSSATACSLANCYSFDGNNPTLSCSSEGIYRLTFPSSWSSIGIGYSNSSVQATAFGRYRGGSSAAVCWASVDSMTSSSLTIVTSYNNNTEFDACGFFVELKLIK